MLFTELPLLERPAAAKAGRLRRRRVLVAVRRPRCPPTPRSTRSSRAVSDAGVQLVGLNFFAGDMPGGDRGLVSWPARVARVPGQHRRHRRHRRAAGLPGVQRPLRQPGRRRAPRTSRTSWRPRTSPSPAAAAARIGGTVLVEPVSGAARYPLRTAADALAVIDRVAATGVDNVGFLCDLYHLAVNGDDVDRGRSRRYADRIGHVQIADAPAAASPAPARSTSTATSARIAAAGYDG